MKFKYPVNLPTVIIELPGNKIPEDVDYRPIQVKGLTLGGNSYAYFYNAEQRVYHIKLTVDTTQKDSLLSFLRDIVNWAKEEFIWEDDYGNERVVRFWSDSLKITHFSSNYYQISFQLLYIRNVVPPPPT